MDIKEHDVYFISADSQLEDLVMGKTISAKMRRIVSILGNVVCYSTGGDKNRFCKVKTFERWAKRKGTKKIHEANPNPS